MKKLLYLILLSIGLVSFQSCEDDKEVDTAWKNTNEKAFNDVATNPAYVPISIPGGPGTVYCKILNSGTGTKKPIYTSTIKVKYKGTYYDGTVFDSGSSTSDNPFNWTINMLDFSGLPIALQNMVVGDKWEIWIPWYLGYGMNSFKSIPGYSTLVFQVELLDIIRE